MKKLGSILIVLALAVTMLITLTPAQADTASTSTFQPCTLNILLLGNQPGDMANVVPAIQTQLAADGLPFTLNFQFLADYWNQLALAIAGGESDDVAWAHISTLSGLVAKGVYQPIDDAVAQYAPDVKANTPDYVLKSGMVGGKLYALPRVIPMAEYRNCYLIRGDLREKYGIAPITTLDGFNQYLAAIKANEPDMFPLAGDYNVEPLFPVYANYYFPVGDGGRYPVYVDPTDPTHTVKTFFDSDAAANVFAEVQNRVTNGYIPTDDSKITSATSGFENGMVGAIPSNNFSESEDIDTFTQNLPGASIETVLLNPSPAYIYQSADNMLAVPSTSTHVNEAVSLINWIKSSQDNYDLWTYGVKGVNYNLDGNSVSLDGIATDKTYTTMSWMWNDLNLARFSKNLPQTYLDQLKSWDSAAVQTPFIGFALDQSDITAQVGNVDAVLQEYYPALCKGTMNYADVKDDLMQKLNDSGIQDIVNAVQTQLNAYLAATPAQ